MEAESHCMLRAPAIKPYRPHSAPVAPTSGPQIILSQRLMLHPVHASFSRWQMVRHAPPAAYAISVTGGDCAADSASSPKKKTCTVDMSCARPRSRMLLFSHTFIYETSARPLVMYFYCSQPVCVACLNTIPLGLYRAETCNCGGHRVASQELLVQLAKIFSLTS
eukprot:1079725-Rhodomonas_salina.2